MKRNSRIAAVALFAALGFVKIAAVTHTIKNSSDTWVTAELHYRGCKPDTRGIASEKLLVSQRGNNCLLEYVRITPGNKTHGYKEIKLNLGKAYGLIVAPGVNTAWDYNGDTLVPTEGIDGIGYHNFTQSN